MPEDQNTPPAGSTPAKISIDEALDTIESQKVTIADLTKKIETVTKERDDANNVLNAQLKASLRTKVRAVSNLSEPEIQKLSVDEMETLLNAASALKKPVAKSIRFSADEAEQAGIIDVFSSTWRKP